MTTTPGDNQPRPAGQAGLPRAAGQPAAGQPAQAASAVEPGPAWQAGAGGCLTRQQIAELYRLDDGPDADAGYADDPQCGAPGWWLALPAAEQARQIEESLAPPQVRESIAAGFTHSMGGNGRGFAGGGQLDVMLPGGKLAAEVGRARAAGLGRLSDDALIGVLEATQQQESWAAGLMIDVVNELDDRRARPDGGDSDYVAPEVAKALTLTPRSAQILLERARVLDKFPSVLALVRNGIIDARKADLISGRLDLLPPALAARILDVILPLAGALTTGELRERLEHAIIAADPAYAIKRREKAQRNARVETWTEDAGTAAIAGRDLDPADVITIDQQLTADARWLKTHGTPGTIELLRAKALTARATGQPLHTLLTPAPGASAGPGSAGSGSAADTSHPSAPGNTAPGGPAPGGPAPDAKDTAPGDTGTSPARRRSGRAVPATQPGGLSGTVNLTIPAPTWLGTSDNPGHAASYGPIDAGTARTLTNRLAASPATRWCLTLVDPAGRAIAHGCAPTSPPATSPPATGPPATSPPATGPPATGPPATGPPATGPPADTSPIAWLASIPLATITTGTCDHQRESPRYRPPDSLRHLINIRSPRCGEPGCRTPARRADHDHTIPYHLGGKTCECNLHPECRRSHRTKQAPGWHVTQPQPGLLIWTTPSGRTYTNTTEPLPV